MSAAARAAVTRRPGSGASAPSPLRRAGRAVVDRAARALGYAPAGPTRARSVYAGAQVSRLSQDWITSPLSADASIRSDFRLLRDRARQLVRDNAYAQRFVSATSDNVVGPDGHRLQALVTAADGSPDRATNAAIEEAWDDWQLAEHASLDGMLPFRDVVALAVEMWAQDGEALLRFFDGADNPHGFAVQLLDADMLDHTMMRAPADGVNEVRMGVERDRKGKPVAYWLYERHPNDLAPGGSIAEGAVRVRVPAADVVHLFTVRRPGQTRGVTDLAAVMSDLHMLGGYQEAELVAARTAAASMFFFTQTKDADGIDPDAEASVPLEAEPATGHVLPPGYDVKQFSAEHPTSAFPVFVTAILRAIASGLGLSYSLLTGDLTGASYGSQRDGSLKERDRWRVKQRLVSALVYRRTYLRWMRMAALTRRLKLPTQDVARYQRHRWLPRGWTWIDPKKDIEAAALEVAYGFTTRTEVAAMNGRDFADVVAQLADEEELLHDAGVQVATGAPVPTSASAIPPAPADAEAAADTAKPGSATADDRGARRRGFLERVAERRRRPGSSPHLRAA